MLLTKLKNGSTKSDFAFLTTQGKPWDASNFRREFYKLLREAKDENEKSLPKVTFHSLRAVVNSMLQANGVDESDRKRILGWSKSSKMAATTYLQTTETTRKNLAAAVAALVPQVPAEAVA